jgi:hypothetical protein
MEESLKSDCIFLSKNLMKQLQWRKQLETLNTLIDQSLSFPVLQHWQFCNMIRADDSLDCLLAWLFLMVFDKVTRQRYFSLSQQEVEKAFSCFSPNLLSAQHNSLADASELWSHIIVFERSTSVFICKNESKKAFLSRSKLESNHWQSLHQLLPSGGKDIQLVS